MNKYKNILTGYRNKSKTGNSEYLDIKNVSDEPVTIPVGGHIFLNLTPQTTLDKNPKIPYCSKSVKVNEENSDMPF